MVKQIKIAGISGSLRKHSFNTMLLNYAKDNLPEGMFFEILSIDNIPLYNGDNDLPAVPHRPETVEYFRKKIQEADALLIVSPEYNYSIPGVLKNALDWASRGSDSPLIKKPIALMGASSGMWGTVRMHLAFQPFLTAMNMQALKKPEVYVAMADTKFDENGCLIDEFTKEQVHKLLVAFKKMVDANN